MKFSPQQTSALSAVSDWLQSGSKPFFYLAGYAGTGKTTLAMHCAEHVAGGVLFAAFTGKAASVMQSRGCWDATTIHKLIYFPSSKGTAKLRQLRDDLEKAKTESERERLRALIRKEAKDVRSPNFRLNEDSDVRNAGLVIIDECSMVNEQMGKDLLSFGTPVLVLGDPAQLPPPFSAGYFTKRDPDFMLTEVHRQAHDSGILQLATHIRTEGVAPYGVYGDDAEVRPAANLSPDEVLSFDQILVGRNKKRHAVNARVRQLLGREDVYPVDGDRLVCLRNNHDLGLLNGATWTAIDCERQDTQTLRLTIADADYSQQVRAWSCIFEGEELGQFDHTKDIQEFDYGYALTTHKSQGSQWPSVIVFDESRFFRKDSAKWLYTAATRASEKLTIIR